MPGDDVFEAAKVIESLFSVLPVTFKQAPGAVSCRHGQEQVERVKRFLELPPKLQEGILRYAESMKAAYLSKKY